MESLFRWKVLLLELTCFLKEKTLPVPAGRGGGAGGAPEAARFRVRASQQLVHLLERQHEEPDPQSLWSPPQQRPRPTGVLRCIFSTTTKLYSHTLDSETRFMLYFYCPEAVLISPNFTKLRNVRAQFTLKVLIGS